MRSKQDDELTEHSTHPLEYTPFVYQARPRRVVDGDTHDLTVDLGFGIHYDIRIRLVNVDTDEIYGRSKESDEYIRGMEQKQFVEDFYHEAAESWSGDWPIIIGTSKDKTGKYGRILATIMRRSDEAILVDELFQEFPYLAP